MTPNAAAAQRGSMPASIMWATWCVVTMKFETGVRKNAVAKHQKRAVRRISGRPRGAGARRLAAVAPPAASGGAPGVNALVGRSSSAVPAPSADEGRSASRIAR